MTMSIDINQIDDVMTVLELADSWPNLEGAISYLGECCQEACDVYQTVQTVWDNVRVRYATSYEVKLDNLKHTQSDYDIYRNATPAKAMHDALDAAIEEFWANDMDDEPESDREFTNALAERIDNMAERIRDHECREMRLALKGTHDALSEIRDGLSDDIKVTDESITLIESALK